MGASVDYLLRDSKTGRLSYRRAYPEELRPFVPGKPREFKRSLGSSSIQDPSAAARFSQAATDYERIVSLARKEASSSFDELDGPRIGWIAGAYRVQLLAEDEQRRATGNRRDPEIHLNNIDGYEELAADAKPEQLRDMFADEATEIARSQGWRIDTEAPSFIKLCYAMIDAAQQANEIKIARDAGKYVETPEAPTILAPLRPQAVARDSGESFQTIAEALINNPRLNFGEATVQVTRTALRYFREVYGVDIKPSAITRNSVSQWLDLLAQRPAKLPKAQRNWPLPKLAREYAGRKDVSRLKEKTLNQNVNALAAIWNKAQLHGPIDESTSNPFSRHSVAVPAPPEVPQEFSVAELNATFALPVFTSAERPRAGRGEAAYWIPLLLLWTGARPEEIAQLLVADILQDAQSGEWLIRITDEGAHPAKGQQALKTSRKGSGRRTFPLPAKLIELGLIDYARWLEAKGETALFPKLRTKGGRGLLYAGFGEWWGEYLREHKVLPVGQGRRQSREFRHNWSTAARKSGISEAAMEYIQGHSRTGKSANVGYGALSPLGAEISKLRFEGLDLGNVKRWTPPKTP
jgi:integrase